MSSHTSLVEHKEGIHVYVYLVCCYLVTHKHVTFFGKRLTVDLDARVFFCKGGVLSLDAFLWLILEPFQ